MPLGVMILGINRESKRCHCLNYGLRQRLRRLASALFCQRTRKLLETPVNFVKRFGARGKEAFQRHTQVRFEYIFLPSFGVARTAFLRTGHRVPSLMFG